MSKKTEQQIIAEALIEVHLIEDAKKEAAQKKKTSIHKRIDAHRKVAKHHYKNMTDKSNPNAIDHGKKYEMHRDAIEHLDNYLDLLDKIRK